MMKKLILALPYLAMATLAVAVFAEPTFAQSRFDFLNLKIDLFIPRGNVGFLEVLRSIINFFLFIAGLTAFFYILYGGFVYLTAGGDAAKAGQGRQYIVNALIGVIIIFASFAIANFIIGQTKQDSGQNVIDELNQ